MLTFSSMLFAGLFVAAPAPQPASAQDADERARVGETHVYEFDADDLEGKVLTEEGTRVRGPRATAFESLISVRRTFLDRLYAHSADI